MDYKIEAIKELISFLKLLFTIFITAAFSMIAYMYEKDNYDLYIIVFVVLFLSLCAILILKIVKEIKKIEEIR